jgi:hypothetical protein
MVADPVRPNRSPSGNSLLTEKRTGKHVLLSASASPDAPKKPRVINILAEDSLSGGTGKVFADSGKQNLGIGNIQGILAAFQRSILELLFIGEVQ